MALLEFRKISKAWGSVQANSEIQIELKPGRIHALIGENGAGKSTLMKILFGLEKADSGEIRFQGKPVRIKSPRDAKKLGIGMIHQHFHLASSLTALDHILLEEDRPLWRSFFEKLDRKSWLQKLQNLSERYQMPVPWTETIDRLSVGIHQRIEILKLLAFDAEILILDEPTAVLTPHEIDQFLQRLKDLRAAGKTIVLITHKLGEVMATADDVTVLRQGKVVSTGPLATETISSLASKMVGSEFVPGQWPREPVRPEVLLKVSNLSAHRKNQAVLTGIQFELRAGEILGIAGIEGNGQSDLIRALTLPQDSEQKFSGSVLFRGQSLLELSNFQIRSLGLSLVPEDRLNQAVIPLMSAKENFQLGRVDLLGRLKIQRSDRDAELSRAFQDFDVRPQDPGLAFGKYSGGNQQKLVFARELGAAPRLLIAAQPTRGVDIGAIERIHETLIRARNQGMAILLISSELEELLRLSDRLLVFSTGQVKAQMNSRADFDLAALGRLMGGEA